MVLFVHVFISCIGEHAVGLPGQVAVLAFLAELAVELAIFGAEGFNFSALHDGNPGEECAAGEGHAYLGDIFCAGNERGGEHRAQGNCRIVGHWEVRFTSYDLRIYFLKGSTGMMRYLTCPPRVVYTVSRVCTCSVVSPA